MCEREYFDYLVSICPPGIIVNFEFDPSVEYSQRIRDTDRTVRFYANRKRASNFGYLEKSRGVAINDNQLYRHQYDCHENILSVETDMKQVYVLDYDAKLLKFMFDVSPIAILGNLKEGELLEFCALGRLIFLSDFMKMILLEEELKDVILPRGSPIQRDRKDEGAPIKLGGKFDCLSDVEC